MQAVTIKTSDGKIFIVDEEIAKHMGTVKEILADESFDDDMEDTIFLSQVDSDNFRKVLIWCKYHECCVDAVDDSDDSSNEEYHVCDKLTSWESNFLDVGSNRLTKYIMAANYLDLKCLLKHACLKINSDGKLKLRKELQMYLGLETGK